MKLHETILSAILTILFTCLSLTIYAQTENSKEKKYSNGILKGSFESNTNIYINDSRINANAPKNPIASNNYLKLDYTLGKFATGIQIEYYPQTLQGYPRELQGFGIPTKYLSWTDKKISLTVGDFFEQFGSGLIFRSWEDRQLGISNSIGGVKAAFNLLDNAVNGKVFYGAPRYYLRSEGMGYKTFDNVFNPYSSTRLTGADISVSLMQLLNPTTAHSLFIEGSVINRHEKDIPQDLKLLAKTYDFSIPNDVLSFSGRISYNFKGFSIKGEYVHKANDFYAEYIAHGEGYKLKQGNAQFIETNYIGKNISLSATFRRLDNMSNRMFRTAQNVSTGNTLNYLPALCQQQTYMLAALNPYTPNPDGETGGQIDAYYHVKKGTALGGKYGMKIHASASLIYSNPNVLSYHNKHRLAYRDLTIDIEKKWNKNLKTIFFASIQESSPTHGNKVPTDAQNVFVLDALYKFSSSTSLRTELQYLYSEELTKDWMAGLLELNLAPYWSFFISDMFNHGSSKTHYYSGGISYSNSQIRITGSYGRNREGMICSGGVCRWQPAYTGGNILFSFFF